ncbi:MAG: hypothetical protein HUK40_16900 [Desulfobacter sp.]|nr:hypothetical protein [Desulfobacter sp.]WDP86969.1 MAG: hypothetical protein HUN05_19080 [Desulfobacter sp.]
MRVYMRLVFIFFLMFMGSSPGFAGAPDPGIIAAKINTEKSLPGFKEFIRKGWSRTTGPYVWSELRQSGGGKERSIPDTDILFQ